MKVITLRNIPSEVALLIETRRQQSGLSLNKTVIRLLEESLCVSGSPGSPKRYRDLDDLAGTWTGKEAREFDEILAEQRRIDPEMWD